MVKKRGNKQIFIVGAVILGILFVSGLYYEGFYNDGNEEFAIHGPHLGSDLGEYLDSDNDAEMGLASTIKSRVKRSFWGNNRSYYKNESAVSSTPTPSVTPTESSPTNPTPTIVKQVPVTSDPLVNAKVEVAPTTSILYSYASDNGFGVAAGGGLTSLSQSDLNMYFSALRDLGVTWVRWDIDWPTVQPTNSTNYNWSSIDRVANTAKSYGIRSLAIITYAPDWAEINNCPSGRFCPPQDIGLFANFAGKVAQRYKGMINAYEIWNEENFQSFWYPTPDASVYADMLKQSYTQIKNVDPVAVVLSGGLAATADSVGGSISPKTFVMNMYSAGAKDYFDGLALHPYSYPVAPDYSATWNSFQQMFDVREIMKANNDTNKKIWITEYGAPTNGPGTQRQINQLSFSYGRDYMNEDSQDVMARGAAQIFSINKSWLGGFFWYSLRDNGTSNVDPENFFGLLRNDWSRKPAFDSLKGVVSSQ